MSKPTVLLDADWQNRGNHWDSLLLWLLTGLLAFMPLSFGAVEAWSELVVIFGAALLSVGLVLRTLLDSNFRMTPSWTYLPLAMILGLIALQLVPLPNNLLAGISPKSIELREELLGEHVPQAHVPQATEERTAISLYPNKTAHDLRMALVFCTLFVAASSLFRSSRQINQFLLVVFVIGCVEAGISLLQILTLSSKIHWMFAERGMVVTSGSFINYSHFSQFMNLSLGAGVALLLIRLQSHKAPGRNPDRPLTDLGEQRSLRLLAGLVLCTVAVLVSMSRNGALSLLAASLVLCVLLYRRGTLSTRGWLLAIAPVCVLAVLFLTCFDLVYERMATLEGHGHFEHRLELTTGVLRVWQDFPWFGVGLGAHEVVFPRYDTAIIASMAQHADNDWAQLLEEFGAIGTAAVLAFLFSILVLLGKLIFRGQKTLSMAAFGLGLGFLATAIHSLSDFGQHLPAIFSLTAVLSGLVVAIARRETLDSRFAPENTGRESPFALRWLSGLGALALLGVVWWWAGAGAIAAHRGETWANAAFSVDARMQEADWQTSDQDYIDLLTTSQHAVDAEPNNAKYGYLLNFYRWLSISRSRNPETGEVLLHPDVLPFVAQIADELARLRSICPTYGPPYGLEGELRLSVLGQPSGATLIRQAAQLAPYHAPTCLAAGQLEAQQGRLDEAETLLARAVALNPRLFDNVARLYLGKLQRPDLAQKLAGNHYGRMVRLANLMDAIEPPPAQYSELAQELREQATTTLQTLVASGEATANQTAQLASIELGNGHAEAAVPLFRRALAQQYAQTSWRLALARALVATGDSEQAMREARIVLRLKPQSRIATQLIKEISVLPVDDPAGGGK